MQPSLRARLQSWAGPCLLVLPLLVPASPWARPSGARCLVVPATVDFGSTPTGDSAIQAATLRNICRSPVTVRSLAAEPQAFGVSPTGAIRIPGMGSAAISLRFLPTDTGMAQGQLLIQSSDSRQAISVALRGAGAAASVTSVDMEVSPSRIAESLPQSHTLGKAITIRNHGADSLPITMRTWVEAPRTGGDSAGPGISVFFFSTILDDDIDNSFTWMLKGVPKVSDVRIRSGKTRTPALSELIPYDLVVVSGYGAWADPDSAGNLLADYVDQGGTVVLMHRALDTVPGYAMSLGGRIVTPEYSPVAQGTSLQEQDVLTTFFADDPLTQSVQWFQSFTVLNAHLQGRGRPLGYIGTNIIAAAYNPDKPVYFINLVPYEPDFAGYNSLSQMFLNIIDRMQGTYNWLKIPVANGSVVFTLAPGETRQMILPVGHDHPLPIGIHHGTMEIWSTYPRLVRIPATLEVKAP